MQLYLAMTEIAYLYNGFYSWPAGAHNAAHVPLKHVFPEFNAGVLARLSGRDPLVFVTSSLLLLSQLFSPMLGRTRSLGRC